MAAKTLDTLDDVRKAAKELMAEGKKIISHFKRLENEYSDWEDRVNELDKVVQELEESNGLTKEDIFEDKGVFSDIIEDDDNLTGAFK